MASNGYEKNEEIVSDDILMDFSREVITYPNVENDEVTVESNLFVEDQSDTLHENTEKLRLVYENVRKCDEAARIDYQVQTCFMKCNDVKCMANIEDSLLNLACSGSVDGLFFAFCFNYVDEDNIETCFNRFFEFGSFEGFDTVLVPLLEEKFGNNVVPYAVFCKADVEHKKQHDSNRFTSVRKEKASCPSSATYQRQLNTNKSSITKSYESMVNVLSTSENLHFLFSMICVIHKNRKFNDDNKSGAVISKVFLCSESDNKFWEEKLFQYRLSGPTHVDGIDLFDNIGDSPCMKTQFLYISLLPNFHKWKWENETQEVKLEQRFCASTRRYPKSPRNRILRAINQDDNGHLIIFCVLKNLLGETCEIPYAAIKEANKAKRAKPCKIKKKKIKTSVPANEVEYSDEENFEDTENDSTNNENENPKEATNDMDHESIGASKNNIYKSNFQESLFSYFCGEIVRNGALKWRRNTQQKKTVLMNDIDLNGNFKKFVFVHVNATINSSGFYDVTCSCQLSRTATLGGEKVLHQCVHTRLFEDILCNENSGLQSNIDQEFLDAAYITLEKTVLEIEGRGDVRKFSVVSDFSTEFVTICKIENTLRSIAQCHANVCSFGKKQKREVEYLNSPGLCDHLKLLHDHINLNKEDFPVEDTVSTEAFLPRPKWEEIFDETSGLYQFGKNAMSKQTVPGNRMSTKLKEQLFYRDHYDSEVEFRPPIPDNCCDCTSGWTSNEFPSGILKFASNAKLYADLRIYEVAIYDRLCLSRNCSLKWSGENECIYRSSPKICAGYEIGWEYVEQVNTSKQTFSGFVNVMTKRYQSRDHSYPFMSVPSFIEWWFGWASHMHIDFRMKCPSCNDISILACDGTKVGLNFTNAFLEPIETPRASEVIPTQLRRHDRCFIVTSDKKLAGQFQEARLHLRYICSRILKRNIEEISIMEYNTRKNILRLVMPRQSLPLFDAMESSTSIKVEEREALARHFLQLSYDCSVDTFVPFTEIDEMKNFIEKCNTNELQLIECLAFSNRQQSFNKELAEVLSVCLIQNETLKNEVLQHLMYLVNFVKEIHEKDIPPTECEYIDGTYNPCKFGRAFYFQQHGQQVRQMRKFSIDGEQKSSSNYDDDVMDICRKVFPQVSKRGTTYLFLWFCPQHGHCYGFHMIIGSEGRKDPAAALYTHLESPPDIVLYDHACSLSEYVKNRESGYFSKTRFFHDIFHGYTHKCSTSFRSGNINLFTQTNSSICEQFNSYIQRIKSSAKNLSQCHFTFYLQFFIHQWNLKQKERFEKFSKLKIQSNDGN